MAGFYVDVPGVRFEYDRDGSIVIYDLTSGPTTATAAEMRLLNDEQGGGSVGGPSSGNAFLLQTYTALAWPEVRDVIGLYCTMDVFGLSSTMTVTKSADTTNGTDGTWTPFLTIAANKGALDIASHCRTNIEAASATGIRGLKFYHGFANSVRSLHIYGHWPLTENPNRLVLCDAVGAVVTDGAYFDFGDAPRATTATKSFRVKNNSSALTANSITVAFETLYDASPTLAGQFQYDFGTGTWVTTGNIGSLAPGGLSGVIQVRRNTLVGAAGGPWQSRVTAVPASMT